MQENRKKLFGTNGIRGVPNVELTPEFCLEMGKAIGQFFGGKISIGSDNRLSGPMIMNSVVSGILSTGAEVVRLGIFPTPAIQYYCKIHQLPGVVITASHNPPEFNGIKCIDSDGTELAKEKEDAIEAIYYDRSASMAGWKNMGMEHHDSSAFELYLNGIMKSVNVESIRKMNLRVAFDAGNGAAYLTTPELLSRLGASVVTLNANPDGLFTSRPSEPKPENIRYLIDIVKSGGFNLGVAHDGDADRAVFIDEKGNFIDGDKTLSLFVKHHIRKGEKVVTPVSSSDSVDKICEATGSRVIRTRVGAPIVSRTMILEKARLGGEENGGIIYGDHQYCRDGAMSLGIILHIMAETGKKLSELISELPEYVITRKAIRTEKPFNSISGNIEKHFTGWSIDRTDGIKIRNGDKWILARPSGTEPIIRLFVQGKTGKESAELMKEVESVLQ